MSIIALRLRYFVDHIRTRFPAGPLIDLHGQHKDPAVLMQGTSSGRSIDRLLAPAGPASTIRPDGLFGQLEQQGF